MNLKKLFLGILACAAISACSKDEGTVLPVEDFRDGAYLTIRLMNSSDATKGDDGGYLSGIYDENYVNNVDFYFYKEDGTYDQHTTKTLSWTTNPDGNNVEKIADATVVLKGLTDKTLPKYVVAVLNDGTPGQYENVNLTSLYAELRDSYKGGNYFLMTNSTYSGTDVFNNFATIIKKENYLKEKPEREELTTANMVSIYVERLAAKVEVGINSGVLSENGEFTLTQYEVDNVKKDITIKVLNWGLNATNKSSYAIKNIKTDWAATFGKLTWNNAAEHRSFWAMSPNYGVAEVYPESFGKTVTDPSADPISNIDTDSYKLKYYSWNNLKNNVGSYDYCMENTNTKTVLEGNDNFYATVTHVLLKAQAKLLEGEDLIRYDGQLFTKTGFFNRVLNQLQEAYKVNTTENGKKFTSLTADDLVIVDEYDGRVSLAFAEAMKTTDLSSSKVDDVELLYTDLEKRLNALFGEGNDTGALAEYYKEGMMYYCIPIEHLAGDKVEFASDGTTTVEEADYGVVRNHYYKLNITKIANLGTAVYNPDHNIVPQEENPTYYIGANINILSWKVVNQGVEL